MQTKKQKQKQISILADFFHQSAPVKIGLSTCKSNMQEVVCYEAARNFVYQIYSRVINKNEKPIARVDFPIQRHHSHADPILPDCTFM